MLPRKRKYVPKRKGWTPCSASLTTKATHHLIGCYQCSQRRIDCDQGQPNCQKCLSKGLQCSGLGFRYKFVDETVVRCKSRQDASQHRSHAYKPNQEDGVSLSGLLATDPFTAAEYWSSWDDISSFIESQFDLAQGIQTNDADSSNDIPPSAAVNDDMRLMTEHSFPPAPEAPLAMDSKASPSLSLYSPEEMEPWKQFLLGHCKPLYSSGQHESSSSQSRHE